MNRATTVRVLLAGAIGLAVLTTACGTSTAGSPQPTPTTRSNPSAPDRSNTPENNALANLEPCDLLSSEEVGRLGLGYPGEEERVGGADTCSWYVSGNGGASAGIRPDQGIDDLNYKGDHAVPTKIGKYDATRIEAPLNAKYICHVVISTSKSSTVQVIATIDAVSTDTAAACDRATKTAELIAPKLP
jgi:hypothetical protein